MDFEFLLWLQDLRDGWRAESGFKGTTGDCVCRAFAIASNKTYKEVYDLINEISKEYYENVYSKKKFEKKEEPAKDTKEKKTKKTKKSK